MNKQKQKIILGVDPGSKETGFAILKGNDLIHYGVKTFRNRKSETDLSKEVLCTFVDLLKGCRPGVLVLEKPYFPQYQTLCYLGIVVNTIRKIAVQENIDLVEYSPRDIRTYLCGTEKATKRQVASVICKYHPELEKYFFRQSSAKQKYWGHMFDAASLCTVYNLTKTNFATKMIS